MTKKINKTGLFKQSLLADELLAGLNWSPVTEDGTARLFGSIDGTEIEIHADDGTDESAIDAIIAAHDPDKLTQGEIAQANSEDARARFLLSQLANKSPQQIHDAMQTKMNNWTSLADAREDLSEWLPLIASVIAWKVI